MADINRDGVADVAIPHPALDTVGILLGNGDGTFGAEQHFPVGKEPIAVAIGDVDGDGRLDLVTANSAASGVSLLRGVR